MVDLERSSVLGFFMSASGTQEKKIISISKCVLLTLT